MKKLFLIAAIGIASIATIPAAKAQVSLSVGLNLGARPDWGPVGYDRAAYYYMPDIGAYYDVPSEEFIYLDGGIWRRSHGLPDIYAGYDYRHGRTIVVNSAYPWRHNNIYVGRYGRPSFARGGYGGRGFGGRGYAGRGYGGRGYGGRGFGGGPRGGFHGNPGGGFHGNPGGGFHGNPGGGFHGGGNHGGGPGGGFHGNPGGGNHGGGQPGGGNHGGGGGGNHGGGGGNHGGGNEHHGH
ncbi:hypothetical protein [Pedobacter sp. L105]|uniref:hypothetical protein n=1 Tax=Pedobacter sp. L105 TaxID=1641871 RepID=UPI00131B7D65|nr:hypothetical protein [Pedobacter sp. L105]